MPDISIIALIFWSLAWVCKAASDAILFRYERSIFPRSQSSWWRLNSHPDWQTWYIPSVMWDGWHFCVWWQWVYIFMATGLWFWQAAVIFALAGIIVQYLGFNVIFSRERR